MDLFHPLKLFCAGLTFTLCVGGLSGTNAAAPPPGDSEFQTLKGGVLSDHLWDLDVPRQDVEPVIMTFVRAYESGDINRFMPLFSLKMKTDSGARAAGELRAEYQELFLGTRERHLILKNTRWSHVGTNIIAESDLVTSMISKRDDQRHERSGAVRFYLSRNGANWIISELYFAYDN